jgi:hypothetical protein
MPASRKPVSQVNFRATDREKGVGILPKHHFGARLRAACTIMDRGAGVLWL